MPENRFAEANDVMSVLTSLVVSTSLIGNDETGVAELLRDAGARIEALALKDRAELADIVNESMLLLAQIQGVMQAIGLSIEKSKERWNGENNVMKGAIEGLQTSYDLLSATFDGSLETLLKDAQRQRAEAGDG